MFTVEENFYQENYKGIQLPEGFFKNNVDQAIDIINDWCHWFFDNHNLNDLSIVEDQDRVKKAVCAQVEYFYELGGNTEMSKSKQAITSLSIGNFSMANSGSNGPSSIYSSKAHNYLRPTGLLYGGIREYER